MATRGAQTTRRPTKCRNAFDCSCPNFGLPPQCANAPPGPGKDGRAGPTPHPFFGLPALCATKALCATSDA
eukprot:6826844-Alexandrium_andersonii.AAC.1